MNRTWGKTGLARSFGVFGLLSLAPALVAFSPPSLEASKGRFLVASRAMQDPRFAQTVILLIDHGSQGTFGLVVNHPSNLKLSEALPEFEKSRASSEILFVGGPVKMEAITLLIRSSDEREGARRVTSDILFTGNADLIRQVLGKKGEKSRYRVFSGHAGWAPGQLDWELKRADWHVLDAHADDVFHQRPSEVWENLILRAESDWVLLPGRLLLGLNHQRVRRHR